MIAKIKNKIYIWLKKGEKFTGTDNIYLAKFGTYLNVNNVFNSVLGLISSIAFARLVSKEIYGDYRYILSFYSIFAIAALQGLDSAIIRGVAKGAENTLHQSLKLRFKYGLFGGLASCVAGIYFFLNNNATFSVCFFIMGVFLPIIESTKTYSTYLEGKKRFDKEVKYGMITQIFFNLAIITTILLTKNLITLVLVYFTVNSFFGVFYLYWTLKKIPPNKTNDDETISYGKHLSLMNILGLISRQLDKILLFKFLGSVQLAIYSFAVSPIEQLRQPFSSIQRLALPKLSESNKENIKKNLPKKIYKSLVFVSLAVIFYNLVASYAYHLFFPQYLDSIFYSRLFSLSLFIFPITLMAMALQAQMMKKQLYQLSIISPIFDIIALLILTPLFGILGVIIARLISYVFYAALVIFFFKRM
jgi:O-antigen/teichoic acid export membrane protein